jgi:glycerol-3-phosphate cytidylyltransferase
VQVERSTAEALPTPYYDVGYASGVFDMFHVGHLRILQHAREHCRWLVVGVAADDYVERLKGSRPVVPFEERVEIVSALRLVDEVVADDSEDKSVAWQRRRFDVIFKGDDWQADPRGERLESQMRALGVDVVYFPYTRHTSSAMLRARLKRHKWL